MWKETERRKWQWKAHELFADTRCSQVVLNFLTMTEVGNSVLAVAGEKDADTRIKGSELELQRERKNAQEAQAPGARDNRDHGGEQPLFLPTPSFMVMAGED